MKQNYALKAMALGIAAFATLSASALRPQLPADAKKLHKAPIALNVDNQSKMVRTPKVPAKYSTLASHRIRPAIQQLDLTAQTASRAINPYGAWEDAGTLDYTFTQLYKNEFINESAMVKTYPYQKRVNQRNEQNFQIKVENWGAFAADETPFGIEIPGSELLLTVTPATTTSGQVVGVVTTETEGVNLGWPCEFNKTDGTTVLVDMYYYDAYTFIQHLAEIYSSITAQIVASYYGSSLYDYSSGSFDLFPSYAGQSGTENIEYGLEWGDYISGQGYSSYWDDAIQLSGKFYNYEFEVDAAAGYFYRNAGEIGGHYKAPFVLNDNIIGVAKVVKGQLATEEELNAAVNEMLAGMNAPTSNMALFTEPNGWFDLDIDDYEDGYYTLLYGVGKEQTAEGIEMECYYKTIFLEGAEYVLDGFAKYQDSFITGFIGCFGDGNGNALTPEQVGLTSNYSTTCSVEKSETTEGSYRLRAPYAQLEILSSQFGYNQMLDYLYYDVSDPANPVIEPSMCGLYITLSSAGYLMGASTLNNLNTEALGINASEFAGVFADNKLTFPAANKDFTFTEEGETYTETYGSLLTLLYDMSSGKLVNYNASSNPSHFLIEMGATDAIKDVEADAVANANAPVEFFNLQGQKVLNPAAGQLVIKKQGGKVSKMIVR